VSPGVIVRVRTPEEAGRAIGEIGAALRRGRWDLVAQWAGALHRFAKRRAKDLPDT
jgi:hypothetical protein